MRNHDSWALVPNKSFGSPVQAPLPGESIFRIPTLDNPFLGRVEADFVWRPEADLWGGSGGAEPPGENHPIYAQGVPVGLRLE